MRERTTENDRPLGGEPHGRLTWPVRLAKLRQLVRSGLAAPPQRRLPQAGPQIAAPDHREVLTLPGIAVYTQSASLKSEQPLLATSGVLCSNNNERTPCQSMTPRCQAGPSSRRRACRTSTRFSVAILRSGHSSVKQQEKGAALCQTDHQQPTASVTAVTFRSP